MSAERFNPFRVPLTGRNVVTASAGTGKTYTIATLVIRLLLESRFEIRELLVVTFTEAATAELRARIRRRLGDAVRAFSAVLSGEKSGDKELDGYARARVSSAKDDLTRLEAAVRDVDEAAISTIHGFCHRMVRESAFESDSRFDAELVTDLGPLRDQVVFDFWASRVAGLPDAVIDELESATFDVREARGLLGRVVRNPDLAVLPAEGENPFEGAFDNAKAAWRFSRSTFVSTLLAAPRSPPVTKSKAEEWRDTIDAAFDRPCPPLKDKLCLGIRKAFHKKDTWKDDPVPDHPFRAFAERLLAFQSTKHLSPSVVAVKTEFATYAGQRLAELERKNSVISFDDLLLILDSALKSPLGSNLIRTVRTRYRAALIDEFQDTDPVQFRIFDAIYSHVVDDVKLPLFLIGDPKQAIYGFRGADVFAYLAAVSEPSNQVHTMNVSYRSDPGLVRAVNALFEPRRLGPKPFLIDGIDSPRLAANASKDSFEAKDGFDAAPLEFLFYANDDEEPHRKGDVKERVPAWIAADISALVRGKARANGARITPGDIAVLTRTNKQCFEIKEALRALRIPAVVLGDETVYKSSEAEELQRLLSAIVEPNPHELRKALTTELLGVTANELAAMESEPALWDVWASRFREWNVVWTERGFVQTFHAMLAEAKIQERLLGLTDGERRMTNLLHLMELLHAASKESHLGPAGLLHFLSVQRATERAGGDAAEIRLESDERAVKLTTIHKSKGLEYPVVYCPYLWDGMLRHPNDRKSASFHDPVDGYRQKLDLGSAAYFENTERAELEALAENVRLLYVALTRAKHRCTVLWGRITEVDDTALFSLLHPPDLDAASEPSIVDFRGRLAAFDDDALRTAIQDRARAAEGSIGIRELDPHVQGVPIEPEGSQGKLLMSREVKRQFDRLWGVASFSGLSQGRHAASIDEIEGRDVDEQLEPFDGSAAAPKPALTPSVLSEFPRGAKAGIFYHSILEHLDFEDASAVRPLVEKSLTEAGYDLAKWLDPVCRSVSDVLETPLLSTDDAPRLGRVSRGRRLDELEFHFPVAATNRAPLTPARLADVFAAHPIPHAGDYAGSLRTLAFVPVEGYLKGYIDLVFEHAGRFYVVDYKTNRLGDHVESYAASALPAAMAHGHYHLQYHLYTLAVHRYLARRVVGYSYDAHFGGALYLFVKGMTARTGATHGVYFEKPPLARIEALSTALSPPETRAEGAAP